MGKFIDYYMSLIISIAVSVMLNRWGIINFDNSKELFQQFPVLGTCSFGFLLTMFTVIIQGNNIAIRQMRERRRPYERFVNFNKYVVILAFFVTVYSFIIGNFKFNEQFPYKDELCLTFYILFLWFIGQTLYFLWVFYTLAKGAK